MFYFCLFSSCIYLQFLFSLSVFLQPQFSHCVEVCRCLKSWTLFCIMHYLASFSRVLWSILPLIFDCYHYQFVRSFFFSIAWVTLCYQAAFLPSLRQAIKSSIYPYILANFDPLSDNRTRWSNKLKQFIGCCRRIVWVSFTILWGCHLMGY